MIGRESRIPKPRRALEVREICIEQDYAFILQKNDSWGKRCKEVINSKGLFIKYKKC